MPIKNWSKLNKLQLGRYAEYYAKMEFTSYGLEVYTSEVDDHGIDFIVKESDGKFLEIQVKSIRKSVYVKSDYVFMQKSKWDINNSNLYLVLLVFYEGELPKTYLIPATAWQNTNTLFRERNYEGLKSKPEYGLNLSNRNMSKLLAFKLEDMLMTKIHRRE